MRPPYPDDLPAVARSGTNPAPGRGPFHPRVPFLNAGTVWSGVVFLGLVGGAVFLVVTGDQSSWEPGMLVAFALGGLVSWLIVAARLTAAQEPYAAQQLEREAARAIPKEALDRVVIHDLAQPDRDGAVARWLAHADAHYKAGRWFEGDFWILVNNRAAEILNRKRS